MGQLGNYFPNMAYEETRAQKQKIAINTFYTIIDLDMITMDIKNFK